MKKRVTIKFSLLINLGVALFLCVAIIKLSYIVLSDDVDGVNIKAFADSIYTKTEPIYASRGNILDSEGESLATTVNSYTLIAYLDEDRTEDENNIRHVVDKEQTALKLAPVLEMDANDLLSTLNKDKYQVEIKRGITELLKSQIDELELDGIDFISSVSRYYPSGTFASYIVGYAKADDDGVIYGELGIEGFYDEELKGIDGIVTYQQDAYGYKIPHFEEVREDAKNGSDIYLTIDSNIQLILENAVNKLSDYDHGFAIMTVMEADTGAIVGSATTPTFNPNDLNSLENYLNPLVSYQYEPGSTMKTFSFASAIEEGIYDGQATYKSGSIEVADATIRDYNRTGWGEITFDKGYAYSSNVATTMLSLELGKATLTDYYTALGFGEKTGIELANEASGEVDFYYDTEIANAGFGQGMSITPVQMLGAYTTMTNDGVMLKPYVVDKIVSEDGTVEFEAEPTQVAKVYSKSTTDYMQNLMYDVVYNGTSDMWIPENVTLIGKTGTAQIASPSGGYLTGETDVIRSFAGIFPKDEPEYIIYMAVEKYTGSQTSLANITKSAIEEIASYAKITDEDINHLVNEKISLDNYISKKVSDSTNDLTALNINPIVIGDGEYVVEQYPLKNTDLFKNDLVFLKTNSDNNKMIDLTGFSYNEVKTYASMVGVDIKINNYGYVESQNIKEGTLLKSSDILEVNLND